MTVASPSSLSYPSAHHLRRNRRPVLVPTARRIEKRIQKRIQKETPRLDVFKSVGDKGLKPKDLKPGRARGRERENEKGSVKGRRERERQREREREREKEKEKEERKEEKEREE